MEGGTRLYSLARHLLLGFVGVVVLYLVQTQNYLLFHSIVELFSITVAFAVFTVVWSARDELGNQFFAILGVGYLFVGGVDLLHTLAYKGMGVFPEAGADLPTQLWIFARYLESATLVGAGALGVVSKYKHPPLREWSDGLLSALVGGYATVVALGLGSMFVFDLFPRAYVAGRGLTDFKILSEYIIIGLLTSSLFLLRQQRDRFESPVYKLLAAAIVIGAVSELAFTAYIDVYGISNAVGHFLKFGSFYLVYLSVVKTGITEPQKTLYRELARREDEARKFEQAVEHSGHAVVITDRTGTIQYVNPAYEAMTGYTEDELLDENPRILKSDEHEETFYEEMWATVLSGNVWESEIVDERKNGEQFVVNQTIAPITDDAGEIEHFVGVHKDISERKKQEQELLQRYELLFDSIRDAIVVADTDRRITNANSEFTSLFGYDLSDVAGKSVKVLYEDDAEFEQMGRAIGDHADERRFSQTVDYEKKSGQVFPGETTVFYLRNADDDVVGVISLIRDVSERENRIQQLQILDRTLRHNLRNDMNIIQGYADVIQHTGSGDATENAQEIIDASDRIIENVSKQREVTNLLSEPQPRKSVDLSTVVEAVVSNIREQYSDGDVSLTAPDECTVRTLPSISRAVEELIENALVHTDHSDPRVDVTVQCGEETIEIRVADDGPGIPEMERDVLRKDKEIGPLYHGSGIGLWLVNLVVQQSDGVLTFEENEPRGSVVTIRLPAN
ncbi:MASE3 domain-containing protein [Halobellus inordinatus]|uniref:MASE3 domain-containing protein n=1 Tax=Halobellus inordinatus TaxID=1126236 RepID=UPI002109405F|nr:MASE3 domain-containing protein [Halobellus inordinatus]